jgi:hypothetical protein
LEYTVKYSDLQHCKFILISLCFNQIIRYDYIESQQYWKLLEETKVNKNYSFSYPRRLFSSIITAIIIVSFFIPFSTRTAYALDVPQPIHPENLTTTTPYTDPPLAIPSFQWSSVTGANAYRLQVDTDTDFNYPIALDVTTQNTSFTIQSRADLYPDGIMYWRVRVEQPTIGNWSSMFSFTKAWATPDNKPVLLAPDNNASITFISFADPQVFSWEPVMGAAKYRFQIASSYDGFATPLWSIETVTTTYQFNTRFVNQNYYWRVVPMNADNILGTPSEVRLFKMAYGYGGMRPVLIEPQNLSHPTFTPTFRWEPVVGADYYHLQFTSDEHCDYTVGSDVITRQASFTPTSTFPNDKWFCWRVRVESGGTLGDWSDQWTFQKQWYLQPILLIPDNLRKVPYPFFSWKPVPGAASYRIEIAENPSFSPLFDSKVVYRTTYAPNYINPLIKHLYWRVQPIDGSGNLGLTSEVREFELNSYLMVPILVYPFYFYRVDDYGQYTVNPYEDRTVAYPIFMWHRVMNLPPDGGIFATAYRIQVDTLDTFPHPEWVYDTKNTSASPTDVHDFTPQIGQDYYWRVCVLNQIGGECLTDPNAGWSRPWKARFDPSLGLPPTSGAAPKLLRPAIGQESVEATPLFEWWPLQGATKYQIEVGRDQDFSDTVFSKIVNIPAYSHDDLMAQNSMGLANFGTYYWRVNGFVDGAWGDWSEVWRFQIASQSDWQSTRILGENNSTQVLIGEDPIGDVITPTYDLSTLYASQSNGYWFLGFNANISTTDMTYVFYIDNVSGSGATAPPADRPYVVTTIPAHQPEYAIYVDKIGGEISPGNTWVYAWEGSGWVNKGSLSDILYSDITAKDGYVELQLPNAAIGMSLVKGSASLMLFSVNTDNDILQDSVPSDPEVPVEIPGNTPVLSRFSAVSDHMNLVYPPNNATGDPTQLDSIPPFFWEWPTGSNPSTPYAGAQIELALDPKYTNRVATYGIGTLTYFGQNNNFFTPNEFGDNIYYWRIQPTYTSALGAWTEGWSFRRTGFTPKNLTTSTTIATPNFSWDMAAGAGAYQLQVATDHEFQYRVIDIQTPLNNYTPPDTLEQGLYYWRVRMFYGGVWNIWSPTQQFTLSFLTPTGLTPNGNEVQYAPTYCWEATLTAARYRLQVSTDVNFNNIYESIDTPNTCWTPTMGYSDNDGAHPYYYWHVALIDGNGRLGNYSYTAIFTKHYLPPKLDEPISGAVPQTPTFIWEPVNGAAIYRFEVSSVPTFYALYDAVETINRQYTPTWMYAINKIYYWRVAMRDRDGKLGPFSMARIIIGNVFQVYLPGVRR